MANSSSSPRESALDRAKREAQAEQTQRQEQLSGALIGGSRSGRVSIFGKRKCRCKVVHGFTIDDADIA